MTLGEKLQLLRKKHGWTQEELAQQISVSRQALSKWESDTAMPDTENVILLSRLFQVSTDCLLLDGETCEPPLPGPLVSDKSPETSRSRSYAAVAAACVAGIALVGILILGILSSVFYSVYTVVPVGEEWIRVYTGLLGFLKTYHLEWLFYLCVLSFVTSAFFIFFPRRKREK